ncbi:MAG: tRNA (adenosine(37)-N6)-threonylcarbamoyltransferase complex dimerization subunit type 1 TsaB [Ignavibacteriae bacterium HGW-Ignavibacteriae-3]|nr:MAG: tRNA (adenosine(37)-N6)-threonylcarbamoyltransferase complex dimerization subunit type 1 TsaB [Ignavibacteriae bacterium HGW-Ignavibacteriae-3]
MSELYPILAIETSGELCSTALLMDDKSFVELNFLQKHIHSRKLIEMTDTVLRNGDIDAPKLKAIAVSMGPGSFTGLRIGLAAAKGIAFGASLPIIPVPTFDAFAYQISGYLQDGVDFSIAFSANIEEVYFARYKKQKNGLQAVEELKLVSKSELENPVYSSGNIFGKVDNVSFINNPSGPTAKSVGDWANIFGQDLLTSDYDYLEPNYFKKFIVKAKK